MSEKVLVVDDERDIANLLEVYLQNENYVVYKYYCAKDAIPCIENEDIDLAILDVMLPDMNGFSLCQLIREKYTYPIIMLTAKIEETDKIKILVMDEPTAGLDPGERVRFRNFISEFSHNRIVLISTHIVSDIEYIATRNAIMKAGKIIDVGTTNELVKQIEDKVWSCVVPAHKMMDYEMRLRIINQRGEDNNQISIRYLADHSEVAGSIPAEPRLEDLYLWLFPQEDVEREGK